MAIPKKTQAYDVLQDVLNDVLVQTGKALNAAAKDGRGGVGQAPSIIQNRLPASIEKFHVALNELESEVLRAKSTLLRDLNQVRARRRPPPPTPTPVPAAAVVPTPPAPAPTAASAPGPTAITAPAHRPAPEVKAVAPPAPMIIDLDSPKLSNVPPPGPPPPSAHPQSHGPSPHGVNKPENKSVAPFPNMGFDLPLSPEVTPAMVSVPAAKTKDASKKNSPRPTAAQTQAAMTGRPASAPPRKETKVPTPQVPKSAASTPQPAAAGANAPAPTAALAAPAPSENLFTDMAFSLVPPAGDTKGQGTGSNLNQSQNQVLGQPIEIDLTNLGSFGMDNFDGNVPDGLQSLDSVIPGTDIDNTIFDLGKSNVDDMMMDYDLGGTDKNNYNDLYSYGGNDTGEDFDFNI